jgi:hypothetical protein
MDRQDQADITQSSAVPIQEVRCGPKVSALGQIHEHL